MRSRDARGAYVTCEENALRGGYIVNSRAWERLGGKKRKERRIKGAEIKGARRGTKRNRKREKEIPKHQERDAYTCGNV